MACLLSCCAILLRRKYKATQDYASLRVNETMENLITWLAMRSFVSKTNKAKHGGQTWNRTRDTRIFSPLLYRLSYLAMT